MAENAEKNDKMRERRKNLLQLFVCGIFIGIFLEIILLGGNKFHLGPSIEPFERNLKITCLILIKHKHLRYVISSTETWIKHCDDYYVVNIQRLQKSLLEFSKEVQIHENKSCSNNLLQNEKFCSPTVLQKEKIRTFVSRSAWSGLCKALHLFKTKQNDWLVIVPDSLMVLMENLKLFVKDLNCEENYYYGYALEHYEADYNALGAGILLSRGTIRKLFEKFQTENDCDNSGKHWRNEDVFLGKYLKELKILPNDTRDEEGRGRFHGYNINNLLHPGKLFAQSDYKKKALYPVPEGFNCCSPFLITLDVSDPDVMYKTYYLLYKLVTKHKEVPKKEESKVTGKSFFWKDFLREKGYSESAIENMTSEEYYKIWEKILPPDVMYHQMRKFLKLKENEN